MQTQRITWRNGLRLNGEPVFISDVQKIYEEQIYAKKLEIYESRKAEIREQCLSTADYEYACRYLADLLGI